MDWIDKQRTVKTPFFVQLLTISTHHPYGVPEKYEGPLEGKERYSSKMGLTGLAGVSSKAYF